MTLLRYAYLAIAAVISVTNTANAAAVGSPFVQENAAADPDTLALIVLNDQGFTEPVTTESYLALYRSIGYEDEARDEQAFADWMTKSGDIEIVACNNPRMTALPINVAYAAKNGSAKMARTRQCKQGETFGYSKKYGAPVVKLGCGNPIRTHARRHTASITRMILMPVRKPGHVIVLPQSHFIDIGNRGPSSGYLTNRVIQDGGGTDWTMQPYPYPNP